MRRIDERSVADTAVFLYLTVATVAVLLISAAAHGLRNEKQSDHCAAASSDVEGVNRNDARPDGGSKCNDISHVRSIDDVAHRKHVRGGRS